MPNAVTPKSPDAKSATANHLSSKPPYRAKQEFCKLKLKNNFDCAFAEIMHLIRNFVLLEEVANELRSFTKFKYE